MSRPAIAAIVSICREHDSAREYRAEVDRLLHGVEYFSTGAMCGCDECGLGEFNRADNGTITRTVDDDETGEEREEPVSDDEVEHAVSCCDEGGFSWSACDSCGSHLGGDRYPAHGVIKINDGREIITHFDICVDCLCYHANGDLPRN